MLLGWREAGGLWEHAGDTRLHVHIWGTVGAGHSHSLTPGEAVGETASCCGATSPAVRPCWVQRFPSKQQALSGGAEPFQVLPDARRGADFPLLGSYSVTSMQPRNCVGRARVSGRPQQCGRSRASPLLLRFPEASPGP